MVLRRAVALILVIVVAAAALVPPVAAADDRRMGVLDILQKIGLAWGGDDVAAIYCHNCGAEITVEDLEGYDGALAGAVCASCGKSLMFDSGTFPVGGFKFSGGGSRGGGAGRDDWDDPSPSPDPSGSSDSQSFIVPSGFMAFPVDILPGTYYTYSEDCISGNTFVADNVNSDGSVVSSSITPINYQQLMGGTRDIFHYYFDPPYDGDYQFYLFLNVTASEGYFHFSGDEYTSHSDSFTNSYKDKTAHIPFFMGYSSETSLTFSSVSYSLPNGKTAYFPYKIVVEAWAYYKPDFTIPSDSEIVNTEQKTIIVNGDTITYNNIYEYGDTYIVYQDSGDDAPAIIYVKDPQTGEVIGMSWYDPSGNCYYYTDFTAPEPTPTPAPTSVPGPTATPGPGGGDGGDGGDDGSGGGIWDTVAGALADLLGVIGKLIGGLLAGILELLTSVIASLSEALPLVNEFSAVIVQFYSFLPAEWQTLLTAAFSIFLILGVVRLFYKG